MVTKRQYLSDADVRSDILQRNEKIKAIATITGQLGTALFAAAAVRIYKALALDGVSFFWIFVSMVLIYVTIWSLGKLEAE